MTKFEIASFGIAVISAAISTLAFMLGDKDNPTVRRRVGWGFLLATVVFALVGFMSWAREGGSLPESSGRPIPGSLFSSDDTEKAKQTPPSVSRDNGFVLYHNKRYVDARTQFEVCVLAFPSYGDCHHGLAMTLRELGEFTSALSEHDKALNLGPKRYDYHLERGSTYMRMMDYPSALADYEACLKLNPDFGDCHNALGMLYREMADWENSLRHHEIALGLNPSRGDFYWERGVTYQRLGKNDLADSDFAKARELGYRQ